MKAQKIVEAYHKARLVAPKWTTEQSSIDDYDSFEDWCCGESAYAVKPGLVLHCDYCIKGRGGKKTWTLISADKRVDIRILDVEESRSELDVMYIEKLNLLIVNGKTFELDKIDITPSENNYYHPFESLASLLPK